MESKAFIVTTQKWCFSVTISYRNQQTYLNRDEDDAKECSHASNEVELVDLVYENCSLKVEQANHRSNNDGSENSIRCVLEQRRDEFESQEHNTRHDDVGHSGVATCHVIHRRSRERACKNDRCG